MAKSAEELLIYLFDEILPKHGMNLRVKQKELSLEMLWVLPVSYTHLTLPTNSRV